MCMGIPVDKIMSKSVFWNDIHMHLLTFHF
jgi:hypothetical protein